MGKPSTSKESQETACGVAIVSHLYDSELSEETSYDQVSKRVEALASEVLELVGGLPRDFNEGFDGSAVDEAIEKLNTILSIFEAYNG